MKLHALSLKGLTVFKDRVDINFDGLPSGLIAVVGSNGQGKTTLTEAAYVALFRELPSRAHGNLYKFAHGKDAFVELRFELGGNMFVSKVLINANSETMSAYLEMDGKPLDECRQGKLAPHTKAIERIVGSSKLLLSSVFGTQDKRGNFAEMSVSDRKVLFTELLGLDQFPAYEKQAKAAADTAEMDLSRLRLEREAAGRDKDRIEEINDFIAAHRQELQEVTDYGTAAGARMKRLQEEITVKASKVTADEATISEQRRALEARRKQNRVAKEEIESKLRARSSELAKAKINRESESAGLASKLSDIEKRIQNNEELLKRADEVRAAVKREEILKMEIAGLEQEEMAAIEAERVYTKAKTHHRELSVQYERVTENIALRSSQVEELKTVPCNAVGIYASCIKITNAVENVKMLPELKQKQKDIAASIAVVDGHLSKNGKRPDSGTFRSERLKLTAELDRVTKDARLAPSLETTTQRIAEHRESWKEVYSRIVEIGRQESLATVDPLLEELGIRSVVIDSEREQISADELRLTGEQDTALIRELEAARTELSVAARSYDEVKTRIGKLEGSIAAFEAEHTRLSVGAGALDRLDAQINAAAENLGDWNLLAKACGPTGVPALEIDAAGPGISALVNDLLQSCFSDRFSVQLTTQKTSADGKRQLEDFGIRVIDTERGRDGTIDDLSGGEKVIVSEALAMSISLYNKSGIELQTLWRDEIVGALDSNNAVKYVAMMRRAMQLGNFHRMLLVVHNPEVAELCDARLRCADGKVSVEL